MADEKSWFEGGPSKWDTLPPAEAEAEAKRLEGIFEALDRERLQSAAAHCRAAGKLLGVDFGEGSPLHEQFESVAGYLIATAMANTVAKTG